MNHYILQFDRKNNNYPGISLIMLKIINKLPFFLWIGIFTNFKIFIFFLPHLKMLYFNVHECIIHFFK